MNTSVSNVKAACYCRLSREDEKLGESVSIDTQKKLLEDYCKTNGVSVFDFCYYSHYNSPKAAQKDRF